MPKSTLTWYKSKANRIIKDIKFLKQTEIAQELNDSKQKFSYRVNNIYPKILPELIIVLDKAGYEIKEKGE